MTGLELSTPRPEPHGRPLSLLTPYLSARASSSLSPVLVCLGSASRGGWSDSSSLVSMARLLSSSGVSVLTCMPLSQARTQDAANAGAPVSTTHIRQTPTGSKRSSWHSTGMSIPADLAASQIVVPSGAVISRPSIVSVTVCVFSGAVIAIQGSIRLLQVSGQQQIVLNCRVWAAQRIKAPQFVVAINHRAQPLRQPVVGWLPALANVVYPLRDDDPAGRLA